MALRPPSVTEPPKPGSREAAQADGFLREVDEALREEEMVNSFKRYAKPVGTLIVAGLLGLGGYLWWEHSQNAAAGELSARAALAVERLEAGEADAASKDFAALAKENNDAIRAMALMQMATIAAKQGKTDEAAKQFAAISGDAKLPQPFRDLATVREVSLKYDTMKPEDVIARLKPLAVPGNAYFGSAGELVGMAYLDQGKRDLAGGLFMQIGTDKSVPASLRARMRQMAGGLGYDAGVDMKEIESADEGAAGAAAQGAPAAPAQQAPKQ